MVIDHSDAARRPRLVRVPKEADANGLGSDAPGSSNSESVPVSQSRDGWDRANSSRSARQTSNNDVTAELPKPTVHDLEELINHYSAGPLSPRDKVNLGHYLSGLSSALAGSEPAKKLAAMVSGPSATTPAQAIDVLAPITIPIRFTRVDVGTDRHDLRDLFDERRALEQVENLNDVWAPAGIQFSFAGLDVKTFATKQELMVPPNVIVEANEVLLRQLGDTQGVGWRYITEFVGTRAVGVHLARTLFDRSVNELGKDQIEVVVVRDGRGLLGEPALAPSFVAGDLTEHGAKTLVEHGRARADWGDTRLVVYGYGEDSGAPHYDEGGKPADVGRYVSVLGHEVGHFLKLNHQMNHQKSENLMFPFVSSNRLLPEQIAVARAAAREIVGPSSAEKAQREKVLNAIATVGLDGSSTPTDPTDAARLMRIYGGFPPEMQKLMASVDRIEIKPGLRGGAEIAPSANGGLVVRINRDFMKADLDATEFFSWREQLNFAGADLSPRSGPETLAARFPQVALNPAQGSSDYLEYLLIHQLGHVLYVSQNLSARWHDLSVSSDFKGEALRYHDTAKDALPEGMRAPTYEAFNSSSFATPYGSQGKAEDFADAVLLRALKLWRGGQMSLVTAPGLSIDLLERFDRPGFAAKRQFIDEALTRVLANTTAP